MEKAMNLKPYKPVVHEPHTIKYPFLERNFSLIISIGFLVGTALAVYFALK